MDIDFLKTAAEIHGRLILRLLHVLLLFEKPDTEARIAALSGLPEGAGQDSAYSPDLFLSSREILYLERLSTNQYEHSLKR